MTVTIYHRPQCSTSRRVLELIREQGIEPVVVDYSQVGWTKEQLKGLLKAISDYTGSRVGPRDLLRIKSTPAEELGLTDLSVSDARLLSAMVKHPVLVERPIVVSEKGAVLARPAEKVLEIL
jgi:arsenate reductase